ncbi:HNH endonuclease [Streptomyces cynarae]|uniref:HNH endonuclease n=1 Tax=Streptomyces cynarae TaxID=2981134 RepID=A0ABY6E4L6_9ACTN|nr:HNH endonuclease signature motif containing protein [Streptomyces cynarae]UXY21540.1 HNH endonuclease [Streptomyces cynarae]
MKPILDMVDKAAVLAYLRSRSLIWPDSEGGCWTWEQYRTPDGYGRFTAQGKQYYAHREGFIASGGYIPFGWTVDHVVCGNRACWNPDHLEAVSNEENVRRARNKRWARFLKEHRAALNVSKKLNGSVIEPAGANQ